MIKVNTKFIIKQTYHTNVQLLVTNMLQYNKKHKSNYVKVSVPLCHINLINKLILKNVKTNVHKHGVIVQVLML